MRVWRCEYDIVRPVCGGVRARLSPYEMPNEGDGGEKGRGRGGRGEEKESKEVRKQERGE
jgi:hypothetical protein